MVQPPLPPPLPLFSLETTGQGGGSGGCFVGARVAFRPYWRRDKAVIARRLRRRHIAFTVSWLRVRGGF